MNPELFSLGGHGFYIWASYLVTAIALLAEVLLVRHRRRRALGMLQEEADLAEEIAQSNESTS